jgi:SEC-C motif
VTDPRESSANDTRTRARALRAPVAALVDDAAVGFYAAEEAAFARAVRAWAGDLNVSYERPLRVCEMADCRAACCREGTQLLGESADRLATLVRTYADWFAAHGLDLDPDALFVEKAITQTAEGDAVVFTATRPYDHSGARPPLPPSERGAACTMLLDDGRCSLQVFSEETTGDPWYFKPVVCWLFPALVVRHVDGRTILTMKDSGSPREAPEYPGVYSPPCARAHQLGTPAVDAISRELDRLGDLAERPTLRHEIATETQGFPWSGPSDAPFGVGRNDPCPCGSGRKYKRCHGDS